MAPCNTPDVKRPHLANIHVVLHPIPCGVPTFGLILFCYVVLPFHYHAFLVILHLCFLSYSLLPPYVCIMCISCCVVLMSTCISTICMHDMLLHVLCVIHASPPLLLFLSFASSILPSSINVQLSLIILSPCPEPLCQISAHLELCWLASKMLQV